MRIKFTKPLFVADRTHAKGEVAELLDEQAKRVIESGHAVPAKANEKLETATLKESNETATK